MLCSIRASKCQILRFRCPRKWTRTFLSEAYNCSEAWERRFESPLLKKINPRNMFLELDQAYQTTRKVSAVDVDIFANILNDPDLADELVNVLHQLRLTPQATNTLESTHHAVIRYLFDHGHKDTLLEVLNDRLNYGIFPDHYSYNYLMDKFIKNQDFASAAKIASLLMLQEDSDHPLCNAFAVYSCHKYLEKPEDWVLPPPAPEEPGEPIKIRVTYLRNPFFDDHFDLREPKHLVGKTLVFFGKLPDKPLERSCLLRGYVLWQKYDRALTLIQKWIDGNIHDVVYREVLPLIEKEISGIPEDKVTEEVKELKTKLKQLESCSLKDGNMTEEMEKIIKEIVQEKEEADIKAQCQIYQDWELNRMNLLQQQLDLLDKTKRLEKVEVLKKELKERERLLTFFEREEEIELQIEQKLQMEDEKYGPPVEIKEDVEANYIPPEITRQPPPTRY